MKSTLYTTALFLLLTACEEKNAKNPLLSVFDTPHHTPPFDKIQLSHYEPGFEEAIKTARQDIQKIIDNPENPDFTNTIVALD